MANGLEDRLGTRHRRHSIGWRIEGLSPREIEVLCAIARLDSNNTGMRYKSGGAAGELGIEYSTVQAHRNSILQKMQSGDWTTAVYQALQRHEVPLEQVINGRSQELIERIASLPDQPYKIIQTISSYCSRKDPRYLVYALSDEMGISVLTVRSHLDSVYKRLGIARENIEIGRAHV